jgi:hypothetical protein
MKHGFAPKHGKRSNIYRRWQHIVQRCINPNDRDYPRYGAKGVEVCDRWRDFNLFLQDMGLPPDRTYSIDRIDVTGNYEPSNCRWATPRQQANNRRTTRYLTIDGETKPLSEWCELYQIGSKTVLYRLKHKNMSHKEAVTTPLHSRRRDHGYRPEN